MRLGGSAAKLAILLLLSSLQVEVWCWRWRNQYHPLSVNGSTTLTAPQTITTQQRPSATLVTPRVTSTTNSVRALTTTTPPLPLPVARGKQLSKPKRRCSTLEEYAPHVPEEVYRRLRAIYNNKSLLVIDKLKELDDVFMMLPEETLALLPTPRAFRRLPDDVQQRVHAVYYSKRMPFEEKMRRLEELIHSLPHDLVKLIPVQSDLPGLVEFDVPVLLQFNGQIETHLLRSYMSNEDFELLAKLLTKPNIPEVTRARLIGKLLKDAYQKDPLNFPLPLGEGSSEETRGVEVPEEIRRLGIHLMFSRNPFDNIDPFANALKLIKSQELKPMVSSEEGPSTGELAMRAAQAKKNNTSQHYHFVDYPPPPESPAHSALDGELERFASDYLFPAALNDDAALFTAASRHVNSVNTAFSTVYGRRGRGGSAQDRARRQRVKEKWRRVKEFVTHFRGNIHQ